MLDEILKLDLAGFRLINHDWSNSFFDWLMPHLREAKTWIPLYIVLIAAGSVKYRKWYFVLLWIAIGAAFIGLADQGGMQIKYAFHRIRPSNDPSLSSWINILAGYRPQSYSFTSNHAINHFTVAWYVLGTLSFYKKWMRWLFILWPAIVCYAQVYVGVHYPLDVICGGLLGILLGYGAAKLFKYLYGKWDSKDETEVEMLTS